MGNRRVAIIGGLRTPFVKANTVFNDLTALDLGRIVVQELVQRSFRQGLLLLGAGKSALRLAPPLVIDETDIDTALGMIDTCLGEIA